jgi:glycosyltransferase involved in cell wall biosynthesis
VTESTSQAAPLISCLCVTENRAAFMPWLLWNYDRQTWPNRELIIVDSSPAPLACEREDVRVIAAPTGANIPAKRNMALRAAQGEIVTWFDDDDWQHPDKLAILVEALADESVAYAGGQHGWFVNL